MDEMSYQEQALAGATGVELIVALYDGLIRFLYRAMQCVEENDVHGRRVAVKKAARYSDVSAGAVAAGCWWNCCGFACGLLFNDVYVDAGGFAS